MIRGLFLLSLLAVTPRACATERVAPAIDMLPGVVDAEQAVDLAVPAAGVIEQVLVHEVEQVEAGQLLARLDDRLARASLQAARAVADRTALIERAQSTVSLAEKYLSRVRDAYEKDAASGLELDEAEGRLHEAQAGLSQAREQQREAQAQVALEKVRLAGHELRAPFAGTVMRITAKPGSAANPNEPILRLVDARRLRVTLYVPVRYYGRLREGDAYTLAAEAPAPPRVQATLTAHEAMIDAATETFRCVFDIENNDLTLPAGFAVTLCEPSGSEL